MPDHDTIPNSNSEAHPINPEGLSVNTDNMGGEIERVVRLVSSSIVTNPSSFCISNRLSYFGLLNNLGKFSFSDAQKKALYCMLRIGVSHPSEMHSWFNQSYKTFQDAIDVLRRRGIVMAVHQGPLVEYRREFLCHNLNTTPRDRIMGITFYAVNPEAVELVSLLLPEIKEEFGNKLARVENAVTQFEAAKRRTIESREKQALLQKQQTDYLMLQNRLSEEVDKLTIRHHADFPLLKSEILKLVEKYPGQKSYLIRSFNTLEQIHSGKRGNMTWDKVLEQAKRRLGLLVEYPVRLNQVEA